MLAALALPGILDPFRDSVSAIFQPSCSSSKPITDSFSCIACGGCDCVADASTGGTGYAACVKSESMSLSVKQIIRESRDFCSESLAIMMLSGIYTYQQYVRVRQ
jgi:hypothetical protein